MLQQVVLDHMITTQGSLANNLVVNMVTPLAIQAKKLAAEDNMVNLIVATSAELTLEAIPFMDIITIMKEFPLEEED